LLEEEGIRWKEQIERIGEELLRLIGDVFLSAATISYLGPFTGAYREPVINAWKEKFANLGIPYSENYSLANTLETPLKIR
jgi:dynein heavy chain